MSLKSVINSIFDLIFFLFSGKSKEAEIKRINKELANIRSKFKGNGLTKPYTVLLHVYKYIVSLKLHEITIQIKFTIQQLLVPYWNFSLLMNHFVNHVHISPQYHLM